MPTTRPRIAITLPPGVYETIRRLSELSGEPMSRIISDLLSSTADPLRRTVALLEAAREAPEEIKRGLRATVAAMERELYGAVGYTCGQMDWLLSELGGAAEPGSAEASADPRIVTRGSGRSGGGHGAV